MIPAVAEMCEIPIIVDASHGTGRKDLVPAMTLAGIMAGANGCLIEFHPDPNNSLSDSEQALSGDMFDLIANSVKKTFEFREQFYV